MPGDLILKPPQRSAASTVPQGHIDVEKTSMQDVMSSLVEWRCALLSSYDVHRELERKGIFTWW